MTKSFLKKIPSEMRSKLLVHCLDFTLFVLIKQLYTALTVACMPKYILF